MLGTHTYVRSCMNILTYSCTSMGTCINTFSRIPRPLIFQWIYKQVQLFLSICFRCTDTHKTNIRLLDFFLGFHMCCFTPRVQELLGKRVCFDSTNQIGLCGSGVLLWQCAVNSQSADGKSLSGWNCFLCHCEASWMPEGKRVYLFIFERNYYF